MRLMKMVLMAVLAVLVGPALAQDRRPDARVEFSSTSVGLVFGFSQGQGSLEFQGRKYPFKVSGVSVATVGISKVEALGQVYRLRDVADFAGRYLAVEGGLTLIQGGGSAVLRNEKGVTLYLQNLQYGLDVTLGGGGLDIAMGESTEPPPPATAGNTPAKPSEEVIAGSAWADY